MPGRPLRGAPTVSSSGGDRERLPPHPERERARALSRLAASTALEGQARVQAALEGALAAVGMEAAMVGEWRHDDLVVRAVTGDAARFGLRPRLVLPLESTLCHRLLSAHSSAVVREARADGRLRRPAAPESAEVGSYVGVQLPFADGSHYGSLCCLGHDAAPYLDEADLDLLQVVAGLMADHLKGERTRPEPDIAYLAYHDPLTGLPNRALLSDQLDVAMTEVRASGQALALLYVDLNGFKLVNDGFGHAAGDGLLRQVADRLRLSLRAGDLLVRQGGDEFLVLLAPIAARDGQDLGIPAREAAAAAAGRMAEQLVTPFAIGEAEVQVDVSVGASLFPIDAADAATLHKHADAAMYAAKKSGGGFETYGRTTASPLARLSLAARLRRALERDEFELHYQPIWRIPERWIMGVEGLLRWRDPERGLVSPAQFIRVAEETGVIDALGDWALGEIAAQAAMWSAEGLHPNFGLNVSPRQLRRPGFAPSLRAVLDGHDLDVRRFVLEITESSWTVEASRTMPVIEELRSSGCLLAVDDFGAGYSSLSRLGHLPVVVIKIDRAFMEGIPEDPQAAAMLAAIFQLAEVRGCDVVAEGVESEAQLRFLIARGCRLAQGFHLGRPVPAADITARLRRSLVPERREDQRGLGATSATARAPTGVAP